MKLIKFLFFIIVVLVIGNVTLTNRTVDESLVMASLNREIAALQNENTIMRAQVASLGSLGNLSQRISDAGFVASPTVATLSITSSVASR